MFGGYERTDAYCLDKNDEIVHLSHQAIYIYFTTDQGAADCLKTYCDIEGNYTMNFPPVDSTNPWSCI